MDEARRKWLEERRQWYIAEIDRLERRGRAVSTPAAEWEARRKMLREVIHTHEAAAAATTSETERARHTGIVLAAESELDSLEPEHGSTDNISIAMQWRHELSQVEDELNEG